MDLDLLDLLEPLLDRLVARPISNLRGRSLARRIGKLALATHAGQGVSVTLPAALHGGQAAPLRPHAWKAGRLKITPSLVSWQRGVLRRGQSRDLSGAQYIRQRRPDWSGTDRRLAVRGYLAPSMRVLTLQVDGEEIEIALPSEAIDAALPVLTQFSRQSGAVG